MKKFELTSRNKIIILLLGYFVVAEIMYFTFKNGSIWFGDDVYYQFQRIQGISKSLQEGLYPSISTINFGKISYAVNIFYPWATLLPFAVVSLFVHDPISTYYMALFFYFLVSLLISHYSMYQFSHSHLQAILFTLIYNFSTYRLIDLLSRAALAEYIASIFLPLCFLGFYETFFRDSSKWYLFAIGFSAIILTHVLTTFMTLLIFIAFLVLNLWKIKPIKERAVAVSKSIVITVLITSLYTGPFLIEEFFQKYPKADPQILRGLKLSDFLQATLVSNANRAFDNGLYNPGLLVLVALILGLLCILKFDRLNKEIYLMGVVTFVISTNIIPWHFFQDTFLSVIQFPYRWLIFSTFFLAVSGSKVVMLFILRKSNYFSWSLVSILGIVMLVTWLGSFLTAIKGEMLSDPKQVISQSMIQKNQIPESLPNQYVYQPKETVKYLYSVLDHQIFINRKVVRKTPKADRGTNVINLDKLKKNEVINLPMIRYRFSNVSVNGKTVHFWKSARGTIEFKIKQQSKNNRIVVSYGSRKLNISLLILTVFGWLFIVLDIFIQKRIRMIEEIII
ncbi:hypothetical protein [Companilactobacillus sp. FL22-1]|uniref:hypothetical protein n=1 Tax=Companilactobacillus sp. FL22-1 TaxID=3373892 RepID=UPI0037551837